MIAICIDIAAAGLVLGLLLDPDYFDSSDAGKKGNLLVLSKTILQN